MEMEAPFDGLLIKIPKKEGSSHFKTTKLYYSWQGEVEEIAVTGKLRFSMTYLLVDFDKGLFTLQADKDQCVLLTLP